MEQSRYFNLLKGFGYSERVVKSGKDQFYFMRVLHVLRYYLIKVPRHFWITNGGKIIKNNILTSKYNIYNLLKQMYLRINMFIYLSVTRPNMTLLFWVS